MYLMSWKFGCDLWFHEFYNHQADNERNRKSQKPLELCTNLRVHYKLATVVEGDLNGYYTEV